MVCPSSHARTKCRNEAWNRFMMSPSCRARLEVPKVRLDFSVRWELCSRQRVSASVEQSFFCFFCRSEEERVEGILLSPLCLLWKTAVFFLSFLLISNEFACFSLGVTRASLGLANIIFWSHTSLRMVQQSALCGIQILLWPRSRCKGSDVSVSQIFPWIRHMASSQQD